MLKRTLAAGTVALVIAGSGLAPGSIIGTLKERCLLGVD